MHTDVNSLTSHKNSKAKYAQFANYHYFLSTNRKAEADGLGIG